MKCCNYASIGKEEERKKKWRLLTHQPYEWKEELGLYGRMDEEIEKEKGLDLEEDKEQGTLLVC